jgi:hypothetical protein
MAELLVGVGKFLGAVGGILTGIFDLVKAKEAFEANDMPMFFIHMFTGVVGIVVAVGFAAGLVSGGVAVVVFICLAAVSLLGVWLVEMFRGDEIEIWLARTPFGVGGDEQFGSLNSQ